MGRASGYYWVRYKGRGAWEPACLFVDGEGREEWRLIDIAGERRSEDMDAIGERIFHNCELPSQEPCPSAE